MNSIHRLDQRPAARARRPAGRHDCEQAARRRAAVRGLLAAACQAEDAEIVARLHGGDPEALRALWHRYARAVFLRCWLVTRNREPAWEATQDTFRAFVAHLPCDCSQPAREWLFATCSRVAADHPTMRASRRRSC